ncbi:hypothetical protein PM082_002248 [Marasmius tenuissimus]|nr:hypothetical protein PM082_002248 [Marasmius tenuissimus]
MGPCFRFWTPFPPRSSLYVDDNGNRIEAFAFEQMKSLLAASGIAVVEIGFDCQATVHEMCQDSFMGGNTSYDPEFEEGEANAKGPNNLQGLYHGKLSWEGRRLYSSHWPNIRRHLQVRRGVHASDSLVVADLRTRQNPTHHRHPNLTEWRQVVEKAKRFGRLLKSGRCCKKSVRQGLRKFSLPICGPMAVISEASQVVLLNFITH